MTQKTIARGLKLKYNNAKSAFDGKVFIVTKTGQKITTLEPEYPTLTNPPFNISTKDLNEAILNNVYEI